MWKAHIHERLKVFAWRVLADTLPSKDLLSVRLGLSDVPCATCGANVESRFHILKECPRSKAITFSNKWGARIEGWPRENTKEIIDIFLNPPRAIWDSFSEKENFTTFALSIFYNCWQFQNDRIFTQKSSILTATSHLDRMVTEFTNFLNFNPTFNVEEEEKWSPPATSMWKVNCDASYKDGSAALGMVIRD